MFFPRISQTGRKAVGLLWAVLLLGAVFPAYAADTVVTQSHSIFDSSGITIKSGDTLTFKNKDEVTHNIQVTDSEGNSEDKGLQKPGQDIQESFVKPGEYRIRCTIHSKMKMKVTVQ